jgi:hypothetical protein
VIVPAQFPSKKAVLFATIVLLRVTVLTALLKIPPPAPPKELTAVAGQGAIW